MPVVRKSGLMAVALMAAGVAVTTAAHSQAVPRALPFASGERAEYQVRLGAVSVGSGSVEIVGVETVHGVPTFHARMRVSGGIPLARVDDRYESWIDTEGIFSRRFVQDVHEVRYRRSRSYDFDVARRTWRRTDGSDDTGTLPTSARSTPMTYLGRDGRQYVVIAAGGHGTPLGPPIGDSLVAFALPR